MDYAPPGHGGPQPGAGRHATPINWERVAYLLSLDCDLSETAAACGVTRPTLERAWQDERRQAAGVEFETWTQAKKALGRARVRERLDILAEGKLLADKGGQLPAVPINIWLSKQRLGYSDRSERTAPGTTQILVVCADVRTKELVEGLLGKLTVPIEDRVLTEDSGTNLTPSVGSPSPKVSDGKPT